MIIFFFYFIGLTIYLTYFIFFSDNIGINYNVISIYTEYYLMLMQFGFFINLGSNLFGVDISNIFMFSRFPVPPLKMMQEKYYIYIFLSLINFLFGSLYLFLLKISLLNYILFVNVLFLAYVTTEIFSFFFSIYFPKKLDYFNVTKTGTHFLVSFAYLILAISFLIMLSSIINKELNFFNIIINLLILILNLSYLNCRDMIFNRMYSICIKRTEKIYFQIK